MSGGASAGYHHSAWRIICEPLQPRRGEAARKWLRVTACPLGSARRSLVTDCISEVHVPFLELFLELKPWLSQDGIRLCWLQLTEHSSEQGHQPPTLPAVFSAAQLYQVAYQVSVSSHCKHPLCHGFVPHIPALHSSLTYSKTVPTKSRASHQGAQIVKIRSLLNPNKGNKT